MRTTPPQKVIETATFHLKLDRLFKIGVINQINQLTLGVTEKPDSCLAQFEVTQLL